MISGSYRKKKYQHKKILNTNYQRFTIKLHTTAVGINMIQKIIFAGYNGYCIFAASLEASTPEFKKAFQQWEAFLI
jgi:hypothetical protein